MEMKGITCKIPLELHNRISDEIRETESTMGKFIEMIINEHYTKEENSMSKGRTYGSAYGEKEMTLQQLVAPCGMNCALCQAYQGKRLACHGCGHGGERKESLSKGVLFQKGGSIISSQVNNNKGEKSRQMAMRFEHRPETSLDEKARRNRCRHSSETFLKRRKTQAKKQTAGPNRSFDCSDGDDLDTVHRLCRRRRLAS